jgi:hypothetical protein
VKETRTEYLARITAEYPGAYHRIDDLMRSWDEAHRREMSEGEAKEARAWGEANVGSADPMVGEKFTLPKGKDNAAPEGGDAAPSEAPPKDTEQP